MRKAGWGTSVLVVLGWLDALVSPVGDGLIARGMTNDDICSSLVISEATVKTHINRIMMKLHASSRVQLVVLAYETGVVRPGHGAMR